MSEITLKVTIKTPERCQLRRSGVFIFSFEHILYKQVLFYVSLTLSVHKK